GSSIFILPQNYKNLDFEFISSGYKFLPLFFVISGCLISFSLYSYGLSHLFSIKSLKEVQFIYYFFNRKWYFDRLYNDIVSKNMLFVGYHITYQTFDRGILEHVGPYSLSNKDLFLMKWVKSQHSGDVIHYIYFFILFTLFILSYSIVIS
ncbi:MAG: dehydrogenase subunit 5, partial [Bacteroidota bacterium]